MMSGETSDISMFFKLEWFEWVMFCDETASFPDDVLRLCHYLVPSIDVGPALTVKIVSPDMYLGAKLCIYRLHNEVLAWDTSPIKYVHLTVRN